MNSTYIRVVGLIGRNNFEVDGVEFQNRLSDYIFK